MTGTPLSAATTAPRPGDPTLTPAAIEPSTTAQATTTPAGKTRVAFVTAGGAQVEATLAVIQRAAQEFAWETSWAQDTASSAVKAAAQSGAAVVVVDGVDLEKQARAIAGNYPQVYFIALHAAGGDPPSNMLALGAPRHDQAGFIAGLIAGLATQTKFVAVIGDPRSADGLKHINGFAHGARYACPKCRIEGIDAASQPPPASKAAFIYAASGCDVFFVAAETPGEKTLVMTAESMAERETGWVIGAGGDVYTTVFANGQAPGADRLLTSVYLDEGAALYHALAAFHDGAPLTGSQPFAASTGAIVVAPYNAPLEVFSALDRQVVATALGRLADGSLETGIDPATGEEK